ncbi:MAG: transcriptional regulator [Armatimonadota bacterium]
MTESKGLNNKDGFTLRRVCELLNGRFLCGEDNADMLVTTACGCDLMSDVLAFTSPGSILLTGLTNSQVVRTAEMLDLKAVVFVRSKFPDENTVNLAKSQNLAVILSPHPLYESCGRLYSAGLSGCKDHEEKRRVTKVVVD